MVSNVERAEVRRRAILDAAEQIFFRHGFAAANIQDVVREARGSMATLYQQFGNKEGLFKAMLDRQVEHLRDPLDHLDVAGKSVREGLQIIGETYLNAVLQKGAVALYKMMVAESHNFPDMIERVLPRRRHVYRVTAAFLAERVAAGEVRDIDTLDTATFFIDMVRGQHQMSAISEPDFAIDPEEIRSFIARAVDLLCRGIDR